MSDLNKVRAQAGDAATTGPSPRERITTGMRTPGPGRFIFSQPDAKGPTSTAPRSKKVVRIWAQPKGTSAEA